jgi:hypothetical protein
LGWLSVGDRPEIAVRGGFHKNAGLAKAVGGLRMGNALLDFRPIGKHMALMHARTARRANGKVLKR